jgi:hypothetical protein
MACSKHNVIAHGKSANLWSRIELFDISQLGWFAFLQPWGPRREQKLAVRLDLMGLPIVAFLNITTTLGRSGP